MKTNEKTVKRPASRKDPPFEIDLTLRKGLVAQTVDGLRRAIESGYYATGDVLPPVRSIADRLGVSVRVPRDAINRLTELGLVNSRTGLGAVVMPRKAKVWKGRVVFVLPEADGSYYPSVLAGELQRRLVEAGYLFSRISTSSHTPSKAELARIDLTFGMKTDLAVTFVDSPAVQRHVSKSGTPFVAIDEKPCALHGCVGNVRFFREAALPELVRHAVRRGVRRALTVGAYDESKVGAALAKAGVATTAVRAAAGEGIGRLADVQRAGYGVVAKALAAKERPDLIVFEDDFLAMGGQVALYRAGVRIPEDVGVVTWANAGFGPVGERPFTRMEMDPVKHGALIAEAILAHLGGRGFPADLEIGPDYVIGETFVE